MDGYGKVSFCRIGPFFCMAMNFMRSFSLLARRTSCWPTIRWVFQDLRFSSLRDCPGRGNVHVFLDPENSTVTVNSTQPELDRVRPPGSPRGGAHVVVRIVARGCSIEENLGNLVPLSQESSTLQFQATLHAFTTQVVERIVAPSCSSEPNLGNLVELIWCVKKLNMAISGVTLHDHQLEPVPDAVRTFLKERARVWTNNPPNRFKLKNFHGLLSGTSKRRRSR